jgi:adenylosuccinate synthase
MDSADPLALIVTDLGYGDGGKGAIADLLCHRLGIDNVYRHSGGPNSVHHVVTERGEHAASCFASHQSSTTRTQLGPDFVIKPASLLREARDLEKRLGSSPLERLTVDPAVRIALPHHAIVGQMREVAAGDRRRGSTGLGIGEAVLDADTDPLLSLTVADCRANVDLNRRIERIAEHKIAQAEEIVARSPCATLRGFLDALKAGPLSAEDVSAMATMFRDLVTLEDSRRYLEEALGRGMPVLCEGAHGTLIDRDHGFAPHVTRRRTTAAPARTLLESLETPARVVTVGIVRAIAFRHGPGPFVTEEEGSFRHVVEPHNHANPWQGRPRHGWFDLVATRYALACNGGADILAVTMLDLLLPLRELQVGTAYRLPIELAEEARDLLRTAPQDETSMRVNAILARNTPRGVALVELLDRCRPILIRLARRENEAAGNPLNDLLVRQFLEFLASPDALGRPADILSFGPERSMKHLSDTLAVRLGLPC